MALTDPGREFRYNQEKVYHNLPPSPWNGHTQRKEDRTTDRSNLSGQRCPACYIKRSRANKCECNS